MFPQGVFWFQPWAQEQLLSQGRAALLRWAAKPIKNHSPGCTHSPDWEEGNSTCITGQAFGNCWDCPA